MSQADGSVGHSRFKRKAERHTSMDMKLKPTVTYGRQNRLLPLRGTHFMRSDLYELPTEDTSGPNYETPVPRRRRQDVREPDPDDPPLSEDELEAGYGNTSTRGTNASPVLSSPSSRTSFERSNEPHPPRSSSPFMKKGFWKPIKKAAPRPEYSLALVKPSRAVQPKSALRETTNVSINPKTKSVAIVLDEPESAEGPTSASSRPHTRREIVQPNSTEAKNSRREIAASRRKIVQPDEAKSESRRKIATPARRLPVDELLMVPSPVQQLHHLRAPESSFAGIQAQDPIADSSSPARKVVGPSTRSTPAPKKETPLTSIRKRLKTPKFAPKSVIALRKKHKGQTPALMGAERDLGDGFDSSELKVRPCQAKKQRKNGTTLLRGFGALQLQPGPLPDVKFEDSSVAFKIEPSGADASVDIDAAQLGIRSDALGEARKDRKVTFSDGVFDEATRAQLSSISAPKRVFEISSDESELEDEDEEDEDEEEDEEDNGDAGPSDLMEEEQDYDQPNGTPPSFQRTKSMPVTYSRAAPTLLSSELDVPRNVGVTLDFRKPTTPGFAKQSSSHRQRQMEVDEMIIDDPFVEQARMVPLAPADEKRNYILDHQDATNGSPEKNMSNYQTHRPRSILRSSTPLQGCNGTRPEDTVANTRRNSIRRDGNAIVESAHFAAPSFAALPIVGRKADMEMEQPLRDNFREETHDLQAATGPYEAVTRRRRTAIAIEENNTSYFGTASSQLQHKRAEGLPQFRRTINQPDAAASHFFEQRRREEADVQVPGSTRIVPETSPRSKTDYMTNLGMSLNVVRQSADSMWTSSQSLPTVKPPRDLKSLTRSVSREHGTLSQSGRRRPTLPFQSPVKVAR